MKVMLINPPAENQLSLEMDEFVVEERGFYPPLGILSIATYLNKKPGFQAEIVDCVAEKLGYDALLARIEHSTPGVVGISSTTFTLIDTLKTARTVKDWRQDAHVCIGGPHARIYPRETMLHPNVDSVITGEAEIAFADMLQRIETGELIEGLPGVLYRGADGAVRGNDQVQYVHDLDAIPFPDRSLINNDLYWSVIGESRPSSTLMTSRGCPYRCRYCLHDRRYRCRSVANVLEEIKHCLSLGIREIFFFDESFAANRAQAKQLCEAIVSNGLRFKWHVRIRVNSIDDELIGLLKRAGCRRLQIGVESGVQEILDGVAKDINLSTVTPTFKKLKRAGFTLFVDFMLGLPGEREREIRKTIDFAKGLAADFAQFSIFIPLPKTAIYEEGLKTGLIKEDYWLEFSRTPRSSFTPPFWNQNFSDEQLLTWYKTAIRNFYFRPVYILKRLAGIRSLRELRRYVRLAWRLFTHVFSKRGRGQTSTIDSHPRGG